MKNDIVIIHDLLIESYKTGSNYKNNHFYQAVTSYINKIDNYNDAIFFIKAKPFYIREISNRLIDYNLCSIPYSEFYSIPQKYLPLLDNKYLNNLINII